MKQDEGHPLSGLITKEEVLDLVFRGIKEGALYGVRMAIDLARTRYLAKTGQSQVREDNPPYTYPNDQNWKY